VKTIPGSKEMIQKARQAGLAVPAFNIPYLPMMEPVIRAVVDQEAFALVEVARIEWMKFESRSPAAVYAEFQKYQQPDYVHLHLDHIPVIDEDQQRVDYLPIIQEAIELGFQSVMVDASRLDLEENIAVTRKVAELAHQAGIPCEAELGAVLGHEAGPLPPYEEIFKSRRGFTRVPEAKRFIQETGCDWLSVAVGSVHGAISAAFKDQKKVEARLDIDLIRQIHTATGVPLVLHGGSGVRREDVLEGIRQGIVKINIGAEIRQAYEQALKASGSIPSAQETVYLRTSSLIRDYFGLSGTRFKS
jgi:fructose-bisphosphate aldolase class II